MKKILAFIGVVIGIIIFILGIVTISGTFGDATSYGESASYGYDSGFASFNGDYYTYSVNNTAETANAARATAANLREISDILRNCFGWFMMCSGLLVCCGFGIVFTNCRTDGNVVKETEKLAINNEQEIDVVNNEETEKENTENKTECFEEGSTQ